MALFDFNSRMQIESLKVFCDLSETESFTKAAQINHVTQSAVSQQISSLERQFRSLLIERSKKKFRLTREGQVLYEYSKQIIQVYDALRLMDLESRGPATARGVWATAKEVLARDYGKVTIGELLQRFHA